MLKTITWTNYVVTIILLLLIYYIFLGAKYYSQEIKNLFSGKRKLFFRAAILDSSDLNEEAPAKDNQLVQPELFATDVKDVPVIEEDNFFEKVSELTLALKGTIAEAAQKNYVKEEFILSLQLVLRKYTFLKNATTLAAINNLIASECDKYGYIQLSAEEQVMLWNE